MQNEKLLIGGVLGLAVGIAVGMLMAPASGTDTRRNIADTAGNWGNTLRDRFRKLTGRDSQTDDPWVEHHRAAEGMSDTGYTS